ncbi:MAG: RuBisCO large subunit C-terminal-like domain-containing protein [Xanthobacteraceae bacterium]
MQPALEAIYHVRCDAGEIEERAHAIAVEQSVEMPITAIDDDFVLREIVGRVLAIEELDDGLFEVRIALAAETVGRDPGQLINMLFGNTSIHDDVMLYDVELTREFAALFGGPRHGLQEWRDRVGAGRRALTCTALKPQGLPPARLAELARQFAQGGIDYVKDDHGLADQAFSPFAARVDAVASALGRSGQGTTRYVPSLSGDLDAMRAQIAVAAQAGVDAVMIAPMIAGLANFHTLVKEHPAIAFMAHPSLAGASRVAPPLLFGKLFRLLGADAVVFPNYGGRFGYSRETCWQIARAALAECAGMRASMPVPAGGMTRERVRELLAFYGADAMLLIGGALLSERQALAAATAGFVAEVLGYPYE